MELGNIAPVSYKKKRYVSLRWFYTLLFLGSVIFLGYKVSHEYIGFAFDRKAMKVLAKVEPQPKKLTDEEKYDLKEYIVGVGDTMGKILEKLEFADSMAYEMIEVSKEVYDLSLVKQGDKLVFFYSKEDQSFQKLKYEISTLEVFILERKDNEYLPKLDKIQYNIYFRNASGEIKESLYQSAVIDGELSPKLIVNFADIFSWDFDFMTEIRGGEKYRIYYEEKSRRDKLFITTGKIFAALFEAGDEKFYAFHYMDPDGDEGYYDFEGNSVEKQFLRSPVMYRYISSGYTNNRFHPILKRYMPHRSIDYVAPYGTPVVTIGDGIITSAGFESGWGNVVRVRHNDQYLTQYGHFSSIPKGIRVGVRVKQGDVIGFVGATGYATGNHLDFTFYKGGSPVNPFETKYPSEKPVKDEFKEEFFERRDELLKNLN